MVRHSAGLAFALVLLGLAALAVPVLWADGTAVAVGATAGPQQAIVASPVAFSVRIQNVAEGPRGFLFAPGVWALHTEAGPLFEPNAPDGGQGLEALAEDGDPGMLAAALTDDPTLAASGLFDTPVGSDAPAPLAPGQSYEITFTTNTTTTNLSLATMLVQSNDLFVAPSAMGIPLFDADGNVLAGTRDVSDELLLWDAGTEVNEAPTMGPNQAPNQPAPNTGPEEGIVSVFSNTTRALPLSGSIVDVGVSESDGNFLVTVANVSADRGAITTTIAPLFYAIHDETWRLFEAGEPAGPAGLEALAEDGSPADLIASYTGTEGVAVVGAVDRPVDGETGPAAPGEMYAFTVTPDTNHRFLSLAAMVVESNDAFVALGPEPVALLDVAGVPRPVPEIHADLRRALAVWDAGTEANEVPGVGAHQAPRQIAPDTGPPDPDDAVRPYRDSTNDLAGPELGGFASVAITGAGQGMTRTFAVTVTNRSGATAYPGLLTPVVWATHAPEVGLFTVGQPASAPLERLAEDGDASDLVGFLGANEEVADVGVAGTAPLAPGESVSFTVTVAADAPRLSLASMVVPSNDTFLAFAGEGIALLDGTGEARSDAAIAADVVASLAAWDAGTERNQAGAAGPDQAPRQAGPDTGAGEGDGTVRTFGAPVWLVPEPADLLRVTIEVVRRPVFLPVAYRMAR